MIDTYSVNITAQAKEQVREIIAYISQKLKAPDAASNLLSLFENSFKSLSYLPYRFPLTKESLWKELKIRKMPIKNYYIYFWIDEENKKVHIISVINSRCNQKIQLSQINLKSL